MTKKKTKLELFEPSGQSRRLPNLWVRSRFLTARKRFPASLRFVIFSFKTPRSIACLNNYFCFSYTVKERSPPAAKGISARISIDSSWTASQMHSRLVLLFRGWFARGGRGQRFSFTYLQVRVLCGLFPWAGGGGSGLSSRRCSEANGRSVSVCAGYQGALCPTNSTRGLDCKARAQDLGEQRSVHHQPPAIPAGKRQLLLERDEEFKRASLWFGWYRPAQRPEETCFGLPIGPGTA